MKLISELTESIEFVTEEVNGKKNLYIEGIFMQAELPNKNGRLYPRSVMEQAVDKYSSDRLNIKTSYGELGHPQGPKINEDRISHLIESLTWNGNDVHGKAKILGTEKGNIARAIIEGGGRLGVSSRGLGSLKENKSGLQEVQNDFYLATPADIVTDPSAPGALVNGIMEGVEWMYDEKNGLWFQQMVEDVKNEVHSLPKSQLNEEKFLEIYTRFVSGL